MKTRKIGQLLVERGCLTSQQLDAALVEQEISGSRIGDILVDRGDITEEELLEVVSERLSVPKVSLELMVINADVIKLVPVDIARRYTLIPIFSLESSLIVAMADPLNILALDEIKFITSLKIQRTIAARSEIVDAIDRYYSVADSLPDMIDSDVSKGEQQQSLIDGIGAESESPIVKLVNLTITKAVKDKASDIHIEPDENSIRIRYRVSGIMREEASPPKSMQNELLSRIKIAAGMDVSEKRLPQDGRFVTSIAGATIDLRVSTLPTIHGEKIVIRILDRRNLNFSFGQLGFSKILETKWSDVIHKPEGLILITGPTSSGKTTSLYTSLQVVNSIEKNIVTVEDPVEYSLPMINQVQINEKSGLTFPSVLRSILRQNPDIIMIGEIRDIETARLAIRSSLTGHLVFSTIHTNDAPSTISRLIDMGIESFLVASSVKGVLGQRLIRANCQNCSQEYKPSDTSLHRAGLFDLASEMSFRRGTGCPRCNSSGLKGQTGIYEYLEITPRLSEAITNNVSVNQIKLEARRSGYVPLFEMGLEKLAEGTICLEELLKVTSNIEDLAASPETPAGSTVHVRSV